MPTTATERPEETVNRIFEDYKETISGIHSLLWQILVNDALKGESIAFVVLYNSAGVLQIAIAHEDGGKQDTMAYFMTEDYAQATDICQQLNADVFGLTLDQSMQIVGRSMRMTA